MPPDNRPAIIEAAAKIRVELIFDFAAHRVLEGWSGKDGC
jgi:hypothetical protein